MTFTVTVDGSPVEIKANSLRISDPANGRSTAAFTILSADRSYRPNLRDRVVMVEDGATIFSGPVERVRERGFFGGSHPGILIDVTAADNNVYAERRFVNDVIPAGTLKQALQVLEPYLDPYGISLDPAQVDGPSLPALDYSGYKRLDEVLNQLMGLTADLGETFVWDITTSDLLRAYQPSTQIAPFNLVGNVLPEVIGDIEVETILNPGYANKVIIKLDPKREVDRQESWTYGTDPYPFQLQYTPESHYGHLLLDTGGGETMGYTGTVDDDGNPVQWWLDPTTLQLTRNPAVPTTGTVYTMQFTGSFSGVYEATDPEFYYDPWERVLTIDSIPDGVSGQAFADAELAKRMSETKTANYSTWEQGIGSGQQQTVNVSARATNAAGMVSEVQIRDLVHRLDRRVTVVTDSAKTNLGRGWRDDVRQWYRGDGGGAAPVVNVDTGGNAGPAPPIESVQYNPGTGKFGGKSTFIFKAAGNSVVMGEGSAITATSFNSCFIAGKNCGITD